MSTDIKLTKTQIWKLVQPGWFLRFLLGKKTGFALKITVPLVESRVLTLGLFLSRLQNY